MSKTVIECHINCFSLVGFLITVGWLNPGPSIAKISEGKEYVLDEGPLTDGQDVSVQLSKKKGSKAKIWRAKVVDLVEDNQTSQQSK